jgi:hypothetical protein
MKTQSAKAKGRRLQQQVASDLLNAFDHLSENDIRSTSMGVCGEDIQMSHAARQCIPFSFEAKNQERVNIWSSIEQARLNAPSGITPAVVFKKNNMPPQVTIPWNVFLGLINVSNKNNSIQVKQLHELSTQINEIASQLS